jgi:hypothetical protein
MHSSMRSALRPELRANDDDANALDIDPDPPAGKIACWRCVSVAAQPTSGLRGYEPASSRHLLGYIGATHPLMRWRRAAVNDVSRCVGHSFHRLLVRLTGEATIARSVSIAVPIFGRRQLQADLGTLANDDPQHGPKRIASRSARLPPADSAAEVSQRVTVGKCAPPVPCRLTQRRRPFRRLRTGG